MKSLIYLFLSVIVLVIGFLGYFGLHSWQIVSKQQAVQACLQTGKVTYKTEDGAEIVQPNQDWYEICLKAKGLQ